MSTRWENFLKNLGEWRGTFAKMALTGEVLTESPSILRLEGQEGNQMVRLSLQIFGEDGAPIRNYLQEHRSLGREIIFFETGAFSKGSIQVAPFADFGAEYGFVTENRRLRFVQLFDQQGAFASLTLIREFRSGTDAPERPPLSIDQLLGVWEGTAYTSYADWRDSTTDTTRLEIRSSNDRLQQHLTFADRVITSQAKIVGNQLLFTNENTPRQITLLPDGGSSNIPLQLPYRQAFFVEAGWLISPQERQRILRQYNDRGEWVSATHVIEYKTS